MPKEIVRHEQFSREVVRLDFLLVAGSAAGGVSEVEPDQTFQNQIVAFVQGEVSELMRDSKALSHLGVVAVDADHRGTPGGPVQQAGDVFCFEGLVADHRSGVSGELLDGHWGFGSA